jgi:hypothetical protein
MRILRNLLAFTVVCGLSAVASAGPVSFQVVVIDPPQLPNFTIIQPNTPQPIDIHWGGCALTPASSYDQCFLVVNDTGHDITSLSLFIPGTTDTNSDPCPVFSNASLELFSAKSCGASNGGFLLNFSGGSIPSLDGDFDYDDLHSFFLIAVDITGPGSLPDATLVVNTPEPSSLIMLSTGLLGGSGLILGDWRRRIFGKSSR